MKQRVHIWTGGQPYDEEQNRRLVESLPVLPDPAPLRRAALIQYHWGGTKVEAFATACSLRTAPWGDEQVTWLHCKAMRAAEIKPDQQTAMMNVLIPAHYVTSIGSGPTFRITRSRSSGQIGVFPPNQITPPDALSLAEVERIIVALMQAERN